MDIAKTLLRHKKTVAHKEAMQERMRQRTATTVKRINVPARFDFYDHIQSPEDLEKGIFNWLRACRRFTAVTFTLADDLQKFEDVKRTRVKRYAKKTDQLFPWEKSQGPPTKPVSGRTVLGKDITEAFSNYKDRNLLAIEVDEEGINVVLNAQPFGPHILADKTYIEELNTSLEALSDEDKAALGEITIKVGDEVPNPEWLPNLVFQTYRPEDIERSRV